MPHQCPSNAQTDPCPIITEFLSIMSDPPCSPSVAMAACMHDTQKPLVAASIHFSSWVVVCALAAFVCWMKAPAARMNQTTRRTRAP